MYERAPRSTAWETGNAEEPPAQISALVSARVGTAATRARILRAGLPARSSRSPRDALAGTVNVVLRVGNGLDEALTAPVRSVPQTSSGQIGAQIGFGRRLPSYPGKGYDPDGSGAAWEASMATDGRRKAVRRTVRTRADTDRRVESKQRYAGIDFRPVWPNLHRDEAAAERSTK